MSRSAENGNDVGGSSTLQLELKPVQNVAHWCKMHRYYGASATYADPTILPIAAE
jgi:hypothetical protein